MRLGQKTESFVAQGSELRMWVINALLVSKGAVATRGTWASGSMLCRNHGTLRSRPCSIAAAAAAAAVADLFDCGREPFP